eukprot:4295610-Pyramimonas_sp.AAC.1
MQRRWFVLFWLGPNPPSYRLLEVIGCAARVLNHLVRCPLLRHYVQSRDVAHERVDCPVYGVSWDGVGGVVPGLARV